MMTKWPAASTKHTLKKKTNKQTNTLSCERSKGLWFYLSDVTAVNSLWFFFKDPTTVPVQASHKKEMTQALVSSTVGKSLIWPQQQMIKTKFKRNWERDWEKASTAAALLQLSLHWERHRDTSQSEERIRPAHTQPPTYFSPSPSLLTHFPNLSLSF